MYISPDECRCDVVAPSWTDIRSLIITRNKIAMHIHQAMTAVSEDRLPVCLPSLYASLSLCVSF